MKEINQNTHKIKKGAEVEKESVKLLHWYFTSVKCQFDVFNQLTEAWYSVQSFRLKTWKKGQWTPHLLVY